MFVYILISPLHLKSRFACVKLTRLLKLKGVHFEGAVKRAKIVRYKSQIVHLWHKRVFVSAILVVERNSKKELILIFSHICFNSLSV